MQALNQHKISSNPTTSSVSSQIFAFLFPGSPAVNALLATLYISGPPNFLLALWPPNSDPSSLSVMVVPLLFRELNNCVTYRSKTYGLHSSNDDLSITVSSISPILV